MEAEFYTLPTYLTACISKACAFSPTAFEKNLHFVDISSETKAKIFIMKCKIMESKIGNCMKVLGQYVSGFSSPADICYIVTNAKQMLNSLLLNAIENRWRQKIFVLDLYECQCLNISEIFSIKCISNMQL